MVTAGREVLDGRQLDDYRHGLRVRSVRYGSPLEILMVVLSLTPVAAAAAARVVRSIKSISDDTNKMKRDVNVTRRDNQDTETYESVHREVRDRLPKATTSEIRIIAGIFAAAEIEVMAPPEPSMGPKLGM